jgi:hypothetical protein
MSLTASVLACLRDAAGPDIRHLDSTVRLWSIVDPPLLGRNQSARRSQIDRTKRTLFAQVARTGRAIIVHPDPPAESDVPGAWVPSAQAGSYQVPADPDLAHPAVEHWLFALGSWRLFSEPRGIESSPDFFRAPADEILAWTERSGPEVAIDSFHDDAHWVVALAIVPPAA